jgi:hypothetical protein
MKSGVAVSRVSVVIIESELVQVLLVKRLMLVISYDAKLSMATILGW